MAFGGAAEAMFDLAEARGDATEEFKGLISSYPKVNQALYGISREPKPYFPAPGPQTLFSGPGALQNRSGLV